MNDKHFKVALILLTLPLSFGGGTTAGTMAKTTGAADTNSFPSFKKSATGSRGFRSSDVAGRFGASPSDFADDLGRTPGAFVSSFGAVDTNCLSSTTVNQNPELDRPNGDCFPAGNNSSAGNSAMGFPMYDSSSNSETSQYSHVAGSAGPLGPAGAFGGGIGSGTGPTSTPIATPEPGSLVLLVGGLLTLAGLAGRRRQRNAA
jgi:hypothetical protein